MNSSIGKEYYWDIANSTQMGRYLTTIEEDFISTYLKGDGQVKSILDVGGGSGRIAIPLNNKGYKIFVVEADPLPLLKLKSKKTELPAIYVGKSSKFFPFKSGTFDCILCLQVIDLAEESDWFFIECRRILKEQGTFIFSILNGNSYKGFLRKWQLTREVVKGKYWKKKEYQKTLSEIQCNIKGAGFSLMKAKGYNWIPFTRSSNQWTIPLFAFLERIMGLNLLTSLSPWVILVAKKKGV